MKKIFWLLFFIAVSTLSYSQTNFEPSQSGMYFGFEAEFGGTKIKGKIDNDLSNGAFVAGLDFALGAQKVSSDRSITAVMGTVGAELVAFSYNGDLANFMPWDLGCQVLKSYDSGFTIGMKVGVRFWPSTIHFAEDDYMDWDNFSPNGFVSARIGYTWDDCLRLISRIGYNRGFVCTLGFMFSI